MIEYFVYILRCSDDTYYVGVTNNLQHRLYEHETSLNENSYTSKRLPVILVYQCAFRDIEEAIRFEKRIKKWSRAKKEALINSDFEALPELSKKKNFKK
ncbi:MAG: GIY-YIG nuclease family protein [Bacteroidetes bacterium]|nr:GIY-YIG nuclease family protein [Bacteroidota bacterium]